MRLFASDRVASIMDRLKWPDDEAITAKMVTRAVENAQKQIEELNYERRKNVLKYDDVMNSQREVIYGERRKILEGYDFGGQAREMAEQVVARTVERYCPADVFPEDWDLDALLVGLAEVFPLTSTKADVEDVRDVAEMQALFMQEAHDAYEAKEEAVTAPMMRDLERIVLLNITDTKWREHLYEMDYLQEGIHLRAYAQKDPADRVPARGVRHVRRADGVDPRGLRALHLPRGVRPSRSPAGPASARLRQPGGGRERWRRGGPAVRQPAASHQRQGAEERPRAHAARARSTRSATGPRSRPRSSPSPAELTRCYDADR